jgi:hypothetical protein
VQPYHPVLSTLWMPRFLIEGGRSLVRPRVASVKAHGVGKPVATPAGLHCPRVLDRLTNSTKGDASMAA